jgi:iron(III) transport system substrate-binding protein
MAEMPNLSGEITVYSGRGKGLVAPLFSHLAELYPNLTLETSYGNAADLVATIRNEGANTPADVFFSVNAGALGQLKAQGSTQSLTDDTRSQVDQGFHDADGEWTGTSGRARTVPYNTSGLDAADVPADIMAFPDLDQYSGQIGWAPTYSSCQAFVTAMLKLEGEAATRDWLEGMQALDIQEYPDEFAVAQAVADGELALGLTNHYYIQRVLDGSPGAPIATAFTSNDAGSVFNVAGAARIDASDNPTMADRFVRHLLSAEAQEFFAIRTYEYPLVDGVDPVGELPPVSELSVPDIDLADLADLGSTQDLMKDLGIL